LTYAINVIERNIDSEEADNMHVRTLRDLREMVADAAPSNRSTVANPVQVMRELKARYGNDRAAMVAEGVRRGVHISTARTQASRLNK